MSVLTPSQTTIHGGVRTTPKASWMDGAVHAIVGSLNLSTRWGANAEAGVASVGRVSSQPKTITWTRNCEIAKLKP